MIVCGETISGICEFRMVSTKWRDNNLDRIACDFRSRSLDEIMKTSPIQVTICVPFCRYRFHSKLTQCAEYQEGVLDKKIVSRELVWWRNIRRGVFFAVLGILVITV